MTSNENIEIINEPSGDMALIGEDQSTQLVSMKVLQDVYNEITGKNEELTKGFDIPYQISFSDIEQLNHKVTQLYEQYNIHSSNCSVTVYHDEDTKQVYSSFERFKMYDKSLLSPTESILLKYNFLIVLPKLKRPQSYTVSVRIGSRVTMMKSFDGGMNVPKMLLKMVAGRSAQVSIQYIDYTVARNFLDVVSSWFKTVEIAETSTFLKFIERRSHVIPILTKYLIGAFSIYLCIKYTSSFLSSSTNLMDFYPVVLLTFLFITVTSSVAHYLGKITENNLDSISELSYLKLNRGDEKEIEKFQKNNKKSIKKVIFSLLASISIGVISSLIATYLIA